MIEIAKNLKEASLLLDASSPALDPRDVKRYQHYYVPRTHRDERLMKEIRTAAHNKRKFQWFYTGHTGSGKSTELFRILYENEEIRSSFIPLFFSLIDEYGHGKIEATDIILSMAKAAANEAQRLRLKLKSEFAHYITYWNKEVFKEEETHVQSEGDVGLRLATWFAKIGEEIKSGSAKRKIIREKMYDDITKFIDLIDEATQAIEKKEQKQVLFVIDQLDHLDAKLCQELFSNHFVTLCRPHASALFVVPIGLVNTEFASDIQDKYSLVPNIKVFVKPGSEDLDPGGFDFFRELIRRFAPLSFFSEQAQKSLFLLSAGILRSMIRYAGDACAYADEAKATQVQQEHVDKVWYEEQAFFRRILTTDDFELLTKIASEPNPKGMEGLGRLIFLKAVIFYPNHEGWYDVHPAVRRIL